MNKSIIVDFTRNHLILIRTKKDGSEDLINFLPLYTRLEKQGKEYKLISVGTIAPAIVPTG